ncbi:Telomerase-binding protein EST1A [Nymphon striatum]|nr:Telomerase-binding protein EST1A [Nymphon striatum]
MVVMTQNNTFKQQMKTLKFDLYRPAQVLYRPGMGRLHKSPKQLQSQQTPEQRQSSPRFDENSERVSPAGHQVLFNHKDHNHPIEVSKLSQKLEQTLAVADSVETSDAERGSKNHSKRPDRSIYVPKSRSFSSSHDDDSIPDSIHDLPNNDKDLSDENIYLESMVITNSKMNMSPLSTKSPTRSNKLHNNNESNFRNEYTASKVNNNVKSGQTRHSGNASNRHNFPSERMETKANSNKKEFDVGNNRGNTLQANFESEPKQSYEESHHSHRNFRNSSSRRNINQNSKSQSENREARVSSSSKASIYSSQEDMKNLSDHHSGNESIDDYCGSMNWGEQVDAENRAKHSELELHNTSNGSDVEYQTNNQTHGMAARKDSLQSAPSMSNENNSPKEQTEDNYSKKTQERRGSMESKKTRRRQKSGGTKRDGRSSHSAPHREQYELPPRFERQKQLAKLQQLERRNSQGQPDAPKDHNKDLGDSCTGNSMGIIRISPNQQAPSGTRHSPVPSTASLSTSPASEMIQRQLFNPSHPDSPTQVTVMKSSRDAGIAGDPYSQQQPQVAHPMCAPNNPPSSSTYILPPYSTGYPMQQLPYGPLPVLHPQPLVHNQWSNRIPQSIAKNMREVAGLEQELMGMFTHGQHVTDFHSVKQCIWKIQVRCEAVILADPDFCCRQNVEQLLWKSAFHQLIEMLRRIMTDEPSYADDSKNKLLKIIEEGTVFYESLLEKQQESFGFELSDFLDSEAVRPQSLATIVKLALISAQKILICLGDLARYKEIANNTTNYGKARNWYLKAQQIAPKNGRPYNQLAILALYARRRLDAVYYYIRSLAASNPFYTAKESLLSLFEEARKKYDQGTRKSADKILSKEEELLEEHRKGKPAIRMEMWIRPDGTFSKCKQQYESLNEADHPDEYVKMSTVDLNRKFIISFLHVHGKIFTKIGMETLNDIVVDMLKQFRCLLSRSPTPMGTTRLLQLVAMNMFAIYNNGLKDSSLESGCRSLLQQQALQVSLEMFALLTERSITLLREHMKSDQYPVPLLFCEDLQQLVPAIKMWMDWMVINPQIWMPPLQDKSLDVRSGCKDDVWQLIAQLLSLIRTLNMDHIHLLDDDEVEEAQQNGHIEAVTLSEDISLAGFVPLMTAIETVARIRMPADKEQTRNKLRVQKMQFFGDYLCGLIPPVLVYDVETESYVSAIVNSRESSSSNTPCSHENSLSEDEPDEDDAVQVSSDDEELVEGSDEMRRLWSEKKKLSKRYKQMKKFIKEKKALFNKTHPEETVLLSINPRYIIADTNAYIDHLSSIKTLVESNCFQLIVPLVVIGELDGLAKGSANSSVESVDPNKTKLAENAALAIAFLEAKFGKKDSHMKAITSKGSILDTIAFRSEDNTYTQTVNDNIILNCCVHLCETNHQESKSIMPDVKKIFRQVVLLTDDRNLRVKAVIKDVPTRTIDKFMSWAQIT